MKEMHVICGPNGAGKTTLIHVLAEKRVSEEFFVAPNPDDPSRPDLSPISKQRIMKNFITKCLNENKSFIFETTGSGKNSILRILREAKIRGYNTFIWYLWLPSTEIAENRVSSRFRQGGHTVPTEEIRKRYENGIKNLSCFIEYADRVVIIDRSKGSSGRLIASKLKNSKIRINNLKAWEKICLKNGDLRHLM